MRVLILGGTAEARSLARDLHDREGFVVTSSLAGRLGDPKLPAGQVRIGGFDGVDGLTCYLRSQRVDTVIDATHPFAATISAHALIAASSAGCRLIALHRAGWEAQPGDRWIRVPDLTTAARVVDGWPAGVVFVTTGRRELAAFAADDRHDFVVRAVEPPEPPLPRHTTVVLGRGPFAFAAELALMREHAVSLLVAKDTGSDMTAAKLAAARELSVPVLLVDRPTPPPAGETAGTAAEVLALLTAAVGRPA